MELFIQKNMEKRIDIEFIYPFQSPIIFAIKLEWNIMRTEKIVSRILQRIDPRNR